MNIKIKKIIETIKPIIEHQDWDYDVPYMLDELNKAIEIDPDCPEIYYWKGIAYTGIGDNTNAEIQFKKAVDLNPYFSDAFLQLAVLCQDSDMTKSMSIYEHILGFDKGCMEAWRGLISDLKYLKQTDRVNLEVDNLIKFNPNNYETYVIASHAYTAQYIFEKPNYELALEYINQAVNLSPKNHEIYYQRFYVLYNLKRYTEALEDLDLQKKLGSNIVLEYNYNKVYKALKKFDAALEICTNEINKSNNKYHYYRERAMVFKEMGDWKNALSDLKAGLKSCPKYELHYKLRLKADIAEIYQLMNNNLKALEFINKAIEKSDNKHMSCEFMLKKADILITISKDSSEESIEHLIKEYKEELKLPYFKKELNRLKKMLNLQ